jgi:GntR family transcriptional regulator
VFFRLNPGSGIPLYQQLMENVKHAIETGALRNGDQLPAMRKVAEDLEMNPNTVARAYRELEHEGIIELKHGSGAYVRIGEGKVKVTHKAQTVVQSAIERLQSMGLAEDEIRRLVENGLAVMRAGTAKARGGQHE